MKTPVIMSKMERHELRWQRIRMVLPFVSVALLLALWVFVSHGEHARFPSPTATWDRFVLIMEHPIKGLNIFGHVWASLQRVCIALVCAWVFGIGFGILTGWYRKSDSLLTPLFTAFRSIPPLAWIPLITIWFGLGEFPKILLVFIGAIPAIVVNTHAGMRYVQKIYLDVGTIFNANARQKLYKIAIPSSLDAIFAGIRTSTSAAWMVVLAAEMLGGKSGVGFLIIRGMDSLDMPLVLLSMIFIGLVGALLAVVTQLTELILCPWMKKSSS
ncbi:ABC transporter permease [Desulfovibrio sp. TomC]|uniref:ABC transporter permease n=1 Tax=Desulfovibrio sp. TomC TaxID=1562888 RepID=UPI000573AD33|nr:ABC transporter permease [Desulfovibrio sp. TomC]KHK01717.1 ABC-type nitrate/sulfonate/bicarbonate transport system, permease component [Desulfovibrio sp. TomC]